MRDPGPTSSAKALPVLLLLLILAATPVRAVSVQEIPSPRPSGWSVDLTGRIPRDILAQIDRLGDRIQAASGAELAVVAVDTTGGVPSRAFATRLFNTWGIGDRRRDNGVLVFAALDDRKVEIVLGRGLSTPPLVRESQEIVQGEMVPRFRQGDPGGALLAGAEACFRRLLDTTDRADPAASEPTESTPAEPAPAPPAAEPLSTPSPVAPLTPVPLTAPVAPAPAEGTSGFLGGGLALLTLAGLGWGGYKLATRPTYCPQCHTPMDLLTSEAAATHFTPVEKTENRLGSVTIEVFHCPGCGRLDKRRRNHVFSQYSSCPECGAVAVEKRRWTVREATYAEDGAVQTDWTCRHCTYHSSTTSLTPRLVQQQTTYDSSSSFSSSSSHSSSSSSSDSGFGGGSSGGDGASGSW